MRGSDRELGSDLDRLLDKARLGAELFGGTREPIRLGRFEVVRRVGRGAMGAVYEARDLQHGGPVALKLLSHVDAGGVYRIKREFRSLAQLVHPNLLVMHELFNESSAWFFSMELVDGVPFDEWVRPGAGVLDEARLRSALGQLIEAVQAIHLAGKLHCDLKPHNVLVTRDGRVVVLDFGLVADQGPREGARDDDPITGTPAYLSPEQAAGRPPTPSSDWYAIGVMLFGALTGRLPFEGESLAVLRDKQLRDAPDPRALCGEPLAQLAGLCSALLCRDPAARAGAGAALALCGAPQAAAASVVPQPPSPPAPPFVGRSAELALLHVALQDARSGQTRVVLLAGRSGVGKSALLDRFTSELGQAVLVLRGRCHERESLPYKVFDSVVHALGEHLHQLPASELSALVPREIGSLLRLFPELGRVRALADAAAAEPARSLDPRQLRNQAFAALKLLLLRLTRRTPVVLLVDDLQWGDIDSARMLSHVLGPSDAPPLLLLGAYRSDEQESSAFLRELTEGQALRSGAPQRVQLEPLPDAAALELVQALLASEGMAGDAQLAAALAAEAEGVPFFITELVQHWKSRTHAAPAPAAPVTLEQALAERVAALPEPARQLLHVLSVAAGPLEQGLALQAAGLPPNEQTALQRLRAVRLARSRGGGPSDAAETYHDRVRESVSRALDPALLRATHAAIARALEANGVTDPDRLAVHHLGAGERSKAARSLEQAAHAAARKLAFNHAAELFQRAIELAEQPAHRHALARPLADALANAGRGAQAARAYLDAAIALAPRQARELELMAAQQYLRAGHLEPGIPLTARLLKQCGIALPDSGRRTVLALVVERAQLALIPIEARRTPAPPPSQKAADRLETLGAVVRELSALGAPSGVLLQTRFLREALRHGDDSHVIGAVATEAILRALFGGQRRRARVEALLAVTDRLAQRLGTPYAFALAEFARAGSELCIGRPAHVEALATRAEHTFRFECQGAHWDAAFTRVWRYAGIELNGDLSILLHEAPEIERDARERDDEYAIASLMLVIPQAYMMRDDPTGALRHLQAQAERLEDDFNLFHLWVMDRTTDVHLYCGDGTRAFAYLQQMWPRFSRSILARSPLLQVNAHFLRGRAAIGALRERPGDRALHRAAWRAVRFLRKQRRPDAAAYAELLAAGLAQREGQVGAACQALERALSICQGNGLGNFALYAKHNLSVALRNARGNMLGMEAETALRAMGVSCAPRWVSAYAPGFERDPQGLPAVRVLG